MSSRAHLVSRLVLAGTMLALFGLGSRHVALAARTLTVNTTADTAPPCKSTAFSLRCAVSQANSDRTGDTINFSIPTTAAGCSGTPRICVIKPTRALPTLTATSTTINGYSQPGARANTNALSAGDNAAIAIRIHGGSAGSGVDGLTVTGGSDTVEGLSITNFAEKFLTTGGIQGGSAITLSGTTATGDSITGNFLGVNPDGVTAGPNQQHGVEVGNGATRATIGGTSAAASNVISGNGVCSFDDCTGIGINVDTGSNTIQGNLVGTTASGASLLGNIATGVVILSNSNTLGGTNAGNVISGNTDGVLIGSSSNTISSNKIGTNAAGTAGLGNKSHGIDEQGSDNAITGNVVSANGDTGIVLLFTGDIVQGNYVGTDATGTSALGNGFTPSSIFLGQPINGTDGIVVCSGPNTIGGSASGAGDGIALVSSGNTVQGNTIGTDVNGAVALPNKVDGIGQGGETTQGVGFCQQSAQIGGSNNTVGGSATGAGNLVSGNTAHGIKLIAGSNNMIAGNKIGTNAAGTAVLGNGSDGVALLASCSGNVCTPSSNNVIGGTASGAGNVISGNGGNGINIDGTGGGAGNGVQGNHIGTDAGATISIPNSANGVLIQNSATSDAVGGTTSGASNTVANNAKSGVLIGSSASDTRTHVSVQRNSIFANGGLGIDLAPQGTVNCSTPPPGPNDYTACPVITSATTTQVSGTACSACTVEVSIASSGVSDKSHGEGKTFLGSTTASSGGTWSLTLAAGQVTSGQAVTATATTAPSTSTAAETSEFSANATVR